MRPPLAIHKIFDDGVGVPNVCLSGANFLLHIELTSVLSSNSPLIFACYSFFPFQLYGMYEQFCYGL